jgi:hypothetical protein
MCFAVKVCLQPPKRSLHVCFAVDKLSFLKTGNQQQTPSSQNLVPNSSGTDGDTSEVDDLEFRSFAQGAC